MKWVNLERLQSENIYCEIMCYILHFPPQFAIFLPPGPGQILKIYTPVIPYMNATLELNDLDSDYDSTDDDVSIPVQPYTR